MLVEQYLGGAQLAHSIFSNFPSPKSANDNIIFKKILKKTYNKIDEEFPDEINPSESLRARITTPDKINVVHRFFDSEQVLSCQYFFSPDTLSTDEEENVWNAFCSECLKIGFTIDPKVEDEVKSRVITCMNYFNQLISKAFHNFAERQAFRQQKEKITTERELAKQVIQTLNTNTKLQKEDTELDYFSIQLESQLKALRLDIRRTRRSLYIILSFVILLSVLIISLCFISGSFGEANHIDLSFLKDNNQPLIVFVLVFSVLVAVLILEVVQLRILTRTKNNAIISLLETHLDYYTRTIEIRLRYKQENPLGGDR